MLKLDILAFAAHPDDVELTCGGTILQEIKRGKKVGIVDLTAGELGTRGNKELRASEAKAASEVLGITVRENLGMKDGFFALDEANQLSIIRMIRKYRPEIILCNTPSDRHPDHGRASTLVSTSVFLARLPKVITSLDDVEQSAWQTRAVYHYIQDRYHRPDFVVDVTDVWPQRMDAVTCYSSQFYNPDSTEPETPISSQLFWEFLDARAREFGKSIGVKYAEGFLVERVPGVKDLFQLS
jgi:bacillithiol biosynthesis deacetylase BshB1